MDPAPGSTDDVTLELRLQAAFDEIERLRNKVAELEARLDAASQAAS